MRCEEISGRQRDLWILLAASAPILQMAGRAGWIAVLIAALPCALLCWAVLSIPAYELPRSKWFCIIQVIWLTAVLSQLVRWSDDAWPSGRDFPSVPLTLLLLSTFSALSGVPKAAQVSSIVFWFAAILLSIVGLSGLSDLNMEYLQPQWESPNADTILILLIPAAGVVLGRKEKTKAVSPLAVLLFFVFMVLWTVGIVSPEGAKYYRWPFYEAAKSLSLFGIAKRFEAIVSVAVTMGYYCLCSFLLSCAGAYARRINEKWANPVIVGAALTAGAFLLLDVDLSVTVLAMIALFVWIIMPLTGRFMKHEKKSKKEEKNT